MSFFYIREQAIDRNSAGKLIDENDVNSVCFFLSWNNEWINKWDWLTDIFFYARYLNEICGYILEEC